MKRPEQLERVAQLMIAQYGGQAELEAAQRADREIDKGNPKADRVWVRIGKAIKHLMEISRASH